MQLLWPFCLVGVQTSLEHLVLAHPVGLTASLQVAGNSLARLDRLDRRRRRWWSWSGRGRCCCLHLGRIARIVLVPGFGRRRARRRAWRRRACRRWRHWRRRKVHSRHGRPHVHVRRAREWPGGTRRKLRPAPVWNWRRLGRHQMLGRRGKLGCLGVIFFAAAASSCSFTGSSPSPPQPVSQPCLSSPSPSPSPCSQSRHSGRHSSW